MTISNNELKKMNSEYRVTWFAEEGVVITSDSVFRKMGEASFVPCGSFANNRNLSKNYISAYVDITSRTMT